jgi:hypothetical protein
MKMKKEVGLWIDHHRTVMVTVMNDKEETREVRSNIEKYMRPKKVSSVKKPQSPIVSTPDEVGARPYGDHLSGYYDGVISLIRNADSIWIFGPGDAKMELKEQLVRQELGGRIVKVETVGKMTDRQIAAKARLYFQL